MMQNCAEVREMISAYIDGELKLNETRKLTKHFEICPACREEYEELRKISELCNEMEEAELPVDFKAELYKKLNIMVPEKSKNMISFLKSSGGLGRYAKLISTAAACILIVFIAKEFLDSPFRYDNYSLGKKTAAEQYSTGKASDTYDSISNGAQKGTERTEAGPAPKVKSGSADGTRQNTAAIQMFDMAAADTASPTNSAANAAVPSAPSGFAAQPVIQAAAPAAPETFGTSAAPAIAAGTAAPAVPSVTPAVPSATPAIPLAAPAVPSAAPDTALQKSAALPEETAAKTQSFARSGSVSRSRYMEIRLTSNQTIFSEQTIDKIKKLADEYNVSSTDANIVKALTFQDAAYTVKDNDTFEIKIEEGKEQEFINKLNTLLNPEEGKITVNELNEIDTGMIKENPEKAIQSQDEQIKARHTTIFLIFQKDN